MSVIESMYKSSVTTHRCIRVSDGQGGFSISYAEIATFDARVCPTDRSGTRVEVADSPERQITYVIYCEAGENIAGGDLAYVDGGELVLEVSGLTEPSTIAHHWEVECLRRVDEESMELGS